MTYDPGPTPPYREGRPMHPAITNALEVLELEEAGRARERAWRESDEARAGRRFYRNMMLSGGRLDVMEALCRGESVPVEVLDQEQVRRYGLR